MELPYRRSLATLEAALPSAAPAESELADALARIQPAMRQVQELEAALAPLRQAWLGLAQRPGPELKQALQVHEQLLTGLIGKIDDVERKLQQARRQLVPAVDACIRHQQMQRAYRAANA